MLEFGFNKDSIKKQNENHSTCYLLLTNCRQLHCTEHYILFHISSKFDFFIGVDMVMCHALICDIAIDQSLTW